MFQFLSIMIFFASLLYGAWYLFGDAEKDINSTVVNYEEFLQEAIERNTQTYDVVFKRADFVSKSTNSSNTNNSSISQEEITIIAQESITVSQSNTSHASTSRNTNSDSGDDSIAAPTGNFGTPSVKKPGSGGPVNCDGGLLYDPCLVVGDPVPASGDMYFGSNKKF